MKMKMICCCLLASIAASAQQITVPYEQFTLPNGLTVILHRDNTIPRATVNVWYHVGSGSEKPKRTGFAHLFEHILFEGSQHVPEGKFDEWLEAAGANNNGSTTEDRTNYYEEIPSNAVDLALFLESDRMGFLIPSLNAGTVGGQRDVVKNERRQSYENRPYGKANLELPSLLYPKDHPYSWPVIGSMEDLSAASYQDVVDFFTTYYTPGNASIAIAGDIDLAVTRKAIEKWFSDVPAGKPVPKIEATTPELKEEKRVVFEDKVQLPRLTMIWLSPPAYQPGNAELDLVSSLLTQGKNSRLYKRLVYDLQIAQSVSSFQDSKKLASEFYITVNARQGVTLSQIEKAVQEEIDKLKSEMPTNRELERLVNQYESGFIGQLESSRNKADQLNQYYYYTGNPDYFNEDFQRYKAVSGNDISSAARQYLRNDARIIMSIVPEGKTELAAKK
ncbi:MAG TPA: pitrilysin family protein [Cyclobacteriaceae bacterium]|jgi:zinc protease|nr:pitrilysin family protein [Cyclobacteriaceae bacterium]